MKPGIVPMRWDGATRTMTPINAYFAKKADELFVDEQVYNLTPVEERSWKSHGHYFACLKEAHEQLNDDQRERWPTVEHLRKHALIKTGFADREEILLASNAEALRFRKRELQRDEFAIIVVEKNVAVRWTAQSQATTGPNAMEPRVFQQSKTAVLDFVADLIGVSTEALTKNAGRAA